MVFSRTKTFGSTLTTELLAVEQDAQRK